MHKPCSSLTSHSGPQLLTLQHRTDALCLHFRQIYHISDHKTAAHSHITPHYQTHTHTHTHTPHHCPQLTTVKHQTVLATAAALQRCTAVKHTPAPSVLGVTTTLHTSHLTGVWYGCVWCACDFLTAYLCGTCTHTYHTPQPNGCRTLLPTGHTHSSNLTVMHTHKVYCRAQESQCIHTNRP